LFVIPRFRRGQGDIGDGVSIWQITGFRVAAHIPHQNYFINPTSHVFSLAIKLFACCLDSACQIKHLSGVGIVSSSIWSKDDLNETLYK
jgi:hypothetical protein